MDFLKKTENKPRGQEKKSEKERKKKAKPRIKKKLKKKTKRFFLLIPEKWLPPPTLCKREKNGCHHHRLPVSKKMVASHADPL